MPIVAGSTILASDLALAGGTTTHDLSLTTTTAITHGLGVSPRFVRLTAVYAAGGNPSIDSVAFSTYLNTTTQSSISKQIWDNVSGAGAAGISLTFRICGANAGISEYLEGAVTVSSSTISIAWTKTGSPTGTANILWEAHP